MKRFTAMALAVWCLAPSAAQTQGVPVDLELVLAVDGSRSIDNHEFALQIGGIAAAFRDPAFHEVLYQAAPEGIAVTLVQWTGHGNQIQVLPWMRVGDAIAAASFASQVAGAGRGLPPGPTGIGSAIRFSYQLLEQNGFAGKRRVIDVSGDGYNNSGNRPEIARDEAMARGIVINGLTVMNDIPLLDHYFTARVIGGPGAFVIKTDDFDGFAAAFLRKLIREVTGHIIGWNGTVPGLASDDPLFAVGTPGGEAPVAEGAETEGLKAPVENQFSDGATGRRSMHDAMAREAAGHVDVRGTALPGAQDDVQIEIVACIVPNPASLEFQRLEHRNPMGQTRPDLLLKPVRLRLETETGRLVPIGQAAREAQALRPESEVGLGLEKRQRLDLRPGQEVMALAAHGVDRKLEADHPADLR